MIKIKILIVDDEIDFCILMESYFSDKNYEVFTAYNLKDGLSLLQKEIPDILFLDNNLPDGEGWQHADEIRQIAPSIRINLISAYHPKISAGMKGENITIWEKPISLNKLEEAFQEQ